MINVLPEQRDRMSILLSDSDEDVREDLRGGLEAAGFRTIEATSGKQAIDIARHQDVHVIVMELEMPDIFGIDVYRIIQEATRFVPCIFTGKRIDQRVLASALEVHAFSLIPKPVNQDVFHDVFDRLIRRYFGSPR